MGPHGEGRLFWEHTSFEGFIGVFEDGKIKEGNFFNQKGFFVGRMELNKEGHLQATIDQPDDEAINAMNTKPASLPHSPRSPTDYMSPCSIRSPSPSYASKVQPARERMPSVDDFCNPDVPLAAASQERLAKAEF